MTLIQLEFGLPVAAMICLVIPALACALFPQKVNALLDSLLDYVASSENTVV